MAKAKIIYIVLSVFIVLTVSIIFLVRFYIANKEIKKPRVVSGEMNVVSFYNSWTSPGESSALNALIKVFSLKYPQTLIMPTSVSSGAGYSVHNVIKKMILTGYPPDSFQVHPGYEGKQYYNAGLLSPMDKIWSSENLEKVVPSVVQDMCKYDGVYYAVPVNIHRVNLIWYNKKILEQNGVDAKKITSWDDFFKACDKLQAAGIKYPVQMGESWTAAHVFEQMLAGVGIDFYQDFINNKITSSHDHRLIYVFNDFERYLKYINPDHGALLWNEVVDRVARGDGAFTVMGDWANQEFKIANLKYGVDYEAIKTPGTENYYGLYIDAFQKPKNILHPVNTDNWLKVVVSKDGQDAFNPVKGSISVRTDSDITKYDTYQQSAISDFWKSKNMFPSIVHGSGAPEEFKIKMGEIVNDFLIYLDREKSAKEMIDFSQLIKEKYTTKWLLK